MILASKTLAAIDAQIVATAEPGHRMHLGASLIGRPCSRELWYRFRWVKEEQHEARMRRLFSRGHHEEPRFVEFLRSIGCEFLEIDPETGKQWRISDCDGHFGGSCDGVGKGLPDLDPEQWFLGEFKTHNAKSFEKLVASGVRIAKPEHYTQMQVYMYKLGLEIALYMAVNKDTDALHLEIVELDETEAEMALTKARAVIGTAAPPPRISETPGNFACKFCSLNRLCHFGDVEPDRNCRTCVNSNPTKDGKWVCTIAEDSGVVVELTEERQREGCRFYEKRSVLEGRQP